MVERPDWNFANDGSPANVPAPAPAQQTSVDRGSWDYDNAGNARQEVVPSSSKEGMDANTNLPVEFLKAMQRTPDGYESSVDMVRDVASARLDELSASFGIDRKTFIAGFDKLSAGLQSKYLTALLHHPHLGVLDLLDLVEKKLTLSESAEAEAFLRGLRSS